MLKGLAIVVIALLALTFANGCGGGGDDSTSSTSAEVSTPEEEAANGSPESKGEGEGNGGGSSGGSSGEESLGGSPGGLSGGSQGSSPSGGSQSSSPSGKAPSGSKGGSSGSGGSGGKGGGSEGQTANASGFTAQVLGICAKHKQAWQEEAKAFIEKSNKKPPKPTEARPEIVLIETVIVPAFQSEADDLSALQAPSSEGWFGGFLTALQQVIDETRDNPKSFLESQGSFGEAAKIAQAHGIITCANV